MTLRPPSQPADRNPHVLDDDRRAPTDDDLLRFDGFTLDRARGALVADAREVILRPKTSAVLAVLLARAGEVVTREQLMEAVWPDVIVTDDSVTQCISEIRRALGAAGPRLLQTLPRRGYLLSTQVRRVPRPGEPRPVAPARRAARWWFGAAGGLALGLAVALAAWWPRPAPVSDAPSARARAEPFYQRGWSLAYGPGDPSRRREEALPLFLEALRLDPGFALAAAEAAFVHTNRITAGVSADPARDLAEAQRLAAMAEAAAPEAPRTLAARAAVLRQQGRFAEALPLYEAAGRSPQEPAALANAGWMRLLLGDPAGAEVPIRTALARAPAHALAPTWKTYLGLAQLQGQSGDFGAAALASPGGEVGFIRADEQLLHRAAALELGGDLGQARLIVRELRERQPQWTLGQLRPGGFSREPAYLAQREASLLEPLRRLGLPD